MDLNTYMERKTMSRIDMHNAVIRYRPFPQTPIRRFPLTGTNASTINRRRQMEKTATTAVPIPLTLIAGGLMITMRIISPPRIEHMEKRKEGSALKKIWTGFWLRCPNCEEGHISDGIFHVRRICEVCEVRFERKSGESAGASVIWISVLPIFALILFFILYYANPDSPMELLLGVPLAFVVIFGVAFYRNVRGIWIAIAYLTGAVYRDEDKPSENDYFTRRTP
jgi:uncharacterized protein (DUF983 family)